jgi:dolichol-phosphate mannosyltransferase
VSAADRGVTVIVPLFNEQASVAELISRLEAALADVPASRIVLVDDGSIDGTVEAAALATKAGRGPAIHLRRLSRNFGLQKAIAAGLAAAMELHPPAESIAVMDGDLQDRPEHLPALLTALRDCDVAYAVRSKRRESAAFRAAARIFYATMSRWSRVPIPADAGNYCVMRPAVASAVLANIDENLFFPGLRAWVGFRQRGVPLERDARADGNSRMGLRRLLRLAVGAFFGYSTLPLQAMLMLAAVTLAGSMLLAVALAVLRIAGEVQVQGIALVAILVLGGLGVTLVFLAVLAYMVSRSPAPTQSRALYVVAEDRTLRAGVE